MQCPVCKSNLAIDEYHDDHILMESELKCTSCQRYQEFYAYGNTETGVKLDTGWEIWQWSYDTDKLERDRINVEIEQAARSACSEWACIKILQQRLKSHVALKEPV